MAQVEDLLRSISRLEGVRESEVHQLEFLKGSLAQKEEEIHQLGVVSMFFQELADREVRSSMSTVERLNTEGLRAVFSDQDFKVRADVGMSHNKVSVSLITSQTFPDGRVVESEARDGFGGAVTTIQGVILRVIVTMRNGLRPVLFLDETLPAVDANYTQNVGPFLRGLCSKLGMDVLLVTHNPALLEFADRAYSIVKGDSSSHFKEERL